MDYPYGKLNKNDEGELQINCFIQKQRLILDFGKKIAWLGFTKEKAIEFAEGIMIKAKELK